MKRLILYGIVGALAVLLANVPMGALAVAKMMPGGGYRGYDMGTGMMQYGGPRAYSMSPAMMDQANQNEPHHRQNQKYLNRKSAEKIFEDYLISKDNPNLKLGKIKDEGSFFEADLLTNDNSLVDKLMVNKDTGRMRIAY